MSYELTEEEYTAIKVMIDNDPRYPAAAYTTVLEAIRFMVSYKALTGAKSGHVTGGELSRFVIMFMVTNYGKLAKLIAADINFKNSEDIGNAVFNMIACKMLHQSPEDKLSHFMGLFNFNEAIDEEVKGQCFFGNVRIVDHKKELKDLERLKKWKSSK